MQEVEEVLELEDGLVLPRSDLKTVIGWWDSIYCFVFDRYSKSFYFLNKCVIFDIKKMFPDKMIER